MNPQRRLPPRRRALGKRMKRPSLSLSPGPRRCCQNLKYSRDLKLLASTQLPAPTPAMATPWAPAAAGEHEGHH